MEITYAYPVNKAYNETLATLGDGRRFVINTQYKEVLPLGSHSEGCAQHNWGRCDCGFNDEMLAGIDTEAMIADARINGLFGAAPKAATKPGKPSTYEDNPGVCRLCDTYCDGDCQA